MVDGGVVDADVSEEAPMAPVNPQTRLAIQEIKSEIVSELMWQLQDAQSSTAALAAQTEKIEAIRSALQVRVGIQSRAAAELRAATEQLCNTMEVYKIFRGVKHTYCFVLDRDNRVTAVKSAHQAFAVARNRQSRALKSVAESRALHAQLDRRLQKEEIKLELLDSAFTFSSKLLLYAVIAARIDHRRRAR